jgi:hypothetical protein
VRANTLPVCLKTYGVGHQNSPTGLFCKYERRLLSVSRQDRRERRIRLGV